MAKLSGIRYLRRLVANAKNTKHNKYITLNMESAEKVIEEFGPSYRTGQFDLRSNSIKAAALNLCIEPKELIDRLGAKKPSDYMEEIARLKSKIKALQEAGDSLCESSTNVKVKREWIFASKL